MTYDYIIVGQGVAGTMMAHALLKRDFQVLVVDRGHHKSSTASAAGLINPVTGRRFVKAWMYEELREAALQMYGELEELLGRKFIYEQPIARGIAYEAEKKNLDKRFDKPAYSKFIHSLDAEPSIKNRFSTQLGWVTLKQGLQVDIQGLIAEYRDYLMGQGQIQEEEFDFSELTLKGEKVVYRGIEAGGIIFAQGAGGMSHPFFDYLNYEPSKGQAEVVELEGSPLDYIYKGPVFVVPLPGRKEHWVGTINKWEFDGDLPEKEMKKELMDKLNSCINEDFTAVESLSGIRMGTKDRKPVIGVHPLHRNLYIFNGMGAKGTSFAPFWSEYMADFLTGKKKEIPNEVSADRYWVPAEYS